MNAMKSSCRFTVLLAVALFSAVTRLSAQTISWAAAADGNWSTAGNWDLNAVPGSANGVALTSTAGSYTVTYSGGSATTIAGLTLTNSGSNTTTLELGGANSSITDTGTLVETANAAVHVGAGATLALSQATSIFSLTGSSLTVDGTLQAGNSSSHANVINGGGSLTINDGGVATTGIIKIGSTTTSATPNSITINTGGTYTAAQVAIGRAGSNNALNLNGGTLKLTGAGGPFIGLDVGQTAGGGTFNLTSGSLTNGALAMIGDATSGAATVNQSGGSWVQSNATNSDVTIGNSATGTETSTYNFTGGTFSITAASGAVHVGVSGGTGTNLLAIGGGTFSAGTLDIQKGTVRISGGTATFGTVSSTVSGNSFQFTGGTLNVGNALNFTNGAAFTVGDGTNTATLNLTGETATFSGGLAIAQSSKLLGSVTITGNVSNGGKVDAGSESTAGMLSVSGNLSSLSTAIYAFELGGSLQGTSFDFVDVNGTAALDGTLSLSLLGGFTPSNSSTYTILTADGGLSGAFSNAANNSTVYTSDGLGSFLVTYVADSLTLSNYSAVPEPGVAALLGMAMTMAGMIARRRSTTKISV